MHDAHTLALGLFAYAGFSDLLDGWIARRWKLQTVVGSVVDPMADKMLMTVLTVCLAYKGALPGTCLTLFSLVFRISFPVLRACCTCVVSCDWAVSTAIEFVSNPTVVLMSYRDLYGN